MVVDQDPNVGFVSLQEIHNVFVEEMRQLDKYVWPDRTHGSRDAVLKHVETIKHKLYKRAQANFEQFLPGFKARISKVNEDEPSAKAAHEARLNQIRGRGPQA